MQHKHRLYTHTHTHTHTHRLYTHTDTHTPTGFTHTHTHTHTHTRVTRWPALRCTAQHLTLCPASCILSHTFIGPLVFNCQKDEHTNTFFPPPDSSTPFNCVCVCVVCVCVCVCVGACVYE